MSVHIDTQQVAHSRHLRSSPMIAHMSQTRFPHALQATSSSSMPSSRSMASEDSRGLSQSSHVGPEIPPDKGVLSIAVTAEGPLAFGSCQKECRVDFWFGWCNRVGCDCDGTGEAFGCCLCASNKDFIVATVIFSVTGQPYHLLRGTYHGLGLHLACCRDIACASGC